MDKDKVSIILPVYNAEKYIEKCVKSILNQTYDNFELIIINDGSTDNTKSIIEKLEDQRIFIKHIQNNGVSNARNQGLKVATGNWIMFVDADDIVLNDYVEKMHTTARNNNADIVMCDFYLLKEGVKKTEKFLPDDIESIYEYDKIKLLMAACMESKGYGGTTTVTNIGVPWGKIYRRESITKNNIYFDDKLQYMEDSVFNLEVLMVSKKIVYNPVPLYFYRVHAKSAVQKYNPSFKDSAFVALEKFKKIVNENPTYEIENAYEYKKFRLFYQIIRRQYLGEECKIKILDRYYGLKELAKSEINGKYNLRIKNLYSLPEFVYAILARCNLYFVLFVLLYFVDRLKRDR